jgi:hypothetical protein
MAPLVGNIEIPHRAARALRNPSCSPWGRMSGQAISQLVINWT